MEKFIIEKNEVKNSLVLHKRWNFSCFKINSKVHINFSEVRFSFQSIQCIAFNGPADVLWRLPP